MNRKIVHIGMDSKDSILFALTVLANEIKNKHPEVLKQIIDDLEKDENPMAKVVANILKKISEHEIKIQKESERKSEKPVCPFCKSNVARPQPIKEKIDGKEGIIGFEVMSCKCGALYSYDPFCDSWDDIMYVVDSLKKQKVEIVIIHNYSFEKHVFYPNLPFDHDLLYPEDNLGHLWFVK